jgi:hypothetical protein
MTCARSSVINNLHIRYADWGVTTPVATRLLDVWDCQFVLCRYALVNLVAGDATNRLHNVLLAGCQAGIGAATNAVVIQGEQVTAFVSDFSLTWARPKLIALTNSLVWGSALNATTVASANVVMTPNATNLLVSGMGGFYLAENSPFHGAGTTNISPALRTMLWNKSTHAPMNLAANLIVSGAITLSPQTPRYANGTPDLGYYYDVLDYTVAGVFQEGGQVTVLPGTAIAVRNDVLPTAGGQFYGTIYGFYLAQGGSFTSHGTPERPNIFAVASLVQERANVEFAQYLLNAAAYSSAFLPGIVTFTADFQPGDGAPPRLDFRFCKSYLPSHNLHFTGGTSSDNAWVFSGDSAVQLQYQDCQFNGGEINFGPPNLNEFQTDSVIGSGKVTLRNNTFDGVNVNLNPTYFGASQVMNCDLQITAQNNLFRGGRWLHLQPVPASDGNWLFTDNLFDGIHFYQGTNAPMEFDNNGYWPLTALQLTGNGDASQLRAVAGANQAGGHEVVLSALPPYTNGLFGKFYLTQTTPLYQAGSRTAADAGLAQYTTFANQGKDASGQPVNIGLHYVAATNSLPLDSDHDGVPDYVEVQYGTDPHNPMTDGITNDAYNVAYDDVDLDGDGLTGRAERILATNPLIQDNPLKLKPVITGYEPSILGFKVELGTNFDRSKCQLSLLNNGKLAEGCELVLSSNGIYQAVWNSTFTDYGEHTLQVALNMPGVSLPKNSPEKQQVNVCYGSLQQSAVTNLVRFYPDTFLFATAGCIFGELTVQSADYRIEIYDTTNNLLTTITNHTDNGVIDEVWDLTVKTNLPPRNDAEFNLLVYITKTGAGVGHGLPASQGANYIDPDETPYYYHLLRTANPPNDTFTLAFGYSERLFFNQRSQMIRDNVQNILFSPVFNREYNHTLLNCYFCDPFAMWTTNDQAVLLDDLGNVGNFFWEGHGSFNSFGARSQDDTNQVNLSRITASDVQERLHNYFGRAIKGGWSKKEHPFRLVILDSCESAQDTMWAKSFGVYTIANKSTKWFTQSGLMPQAFVGWTDKTVGPVLPPDFDIYGGHLNVLFELWMSEVPLDICVREAATPFPNFQFPDMPLGQNWKIFGDPILTRSPQ